MQFCFIRDNVHLVMPVTPGNYRWASGRRMETVNISALGDVFLPGGRSRFTGSFDFLLPSQAYPWMEAGARTDPQYYLDLLNAWSADGRPVRLVITGTQINVLVYLEEVCQEEKDGTGDRYVTVALREHTSLKAAEVTVTSAAAQNHPRTAESVSPGTEQFYTVVAGDCLSVICRRFYGNGTAKYYNALAAYNGIKNPNLIYAGRILKIPPESVLLGGAPGKVYVNASAQIDKLAQGSKRKAQSQLLTQDGGRI